MPLVVLYGPADVQRAGKAGASRYARCKLLVLLVSFQRFSVNEHQYPPPVLTKLIVRVRCCALYIVHTHHRLSGNLGKTCTRSGSQRTTPLYRVVSVCGSTSLLVLLKSRHPINSWFFARLERHLLLLAQQSYTWRRHKGRLGYAGATLRVRGSSGCCVMSTAGSLRRTFPSHCSCHRIAYYTFRSLTNQARNSRTRCKQRLLSCGNVGAIAPSGHLMKHIRTKARRRRP